MTASPLHCRSIAAASLQHPRRICHPPHSPRIAPASPQNFVTRSTALPQCCSIAATSHHSSISAVLPHRAAPCCGRTHCTATPHSAAQPPHRSMATTLGCPQIAATSPQHHCTSAASPPHRCCCTTAAPPHLQQQHRRSNQAICTIYSQTFHQLHRKSGQDIIS